VIGPLDQMVSIPELLYRAGMASSRLGGQRAIAAGKVYIERWNIGLTETTLPRWVLRGVTITCGDKSVQVSDCGQSLRRATPTELV
jgi:ligand-binding sensor protein